MKDLNEVIEQAQEYLLKTQVDATHWNFHACLGPYLISLHSIFIPYLKLQSAFDADLHLEKILNEQLPDGSWHQVKDLNIEEGELNTTIFHYWAIKNLRGTQHAEALVRAREFILKKGGIEASSDFVKIFLALCGAYPWTKLPYIPYITFIEKVPLNYTSFAQWTIPHMMVIAYLRHVQMSHVAHADLDELWLNGKPPFKNLNRTPLRFHEGLLIQKIINSQQPAGSWGGYTIATLMSVVALHDYKYRGQSFPALEQALQKGWAFLENRYFHSPGAEYRGCAMDGHYWDTLIAANTLLDTGVPQEKLESSARYISNTQTASGGFPYGIDFEYAPDVDDTAEAVLLLSRYSSYKKPLEKTRDWLLSMQNEDGGWGAFHKNNLGNSVLKFLTRTIKNSVDPFDDSSADSTGNVLDALRCWNLDVYNSQAVRDGVDYLRKTQSQSVPAWEGRWGVNYLFGSCCALYGLLGVGVDENEKFIENSLNWLESCQNPDGGFGESTLSYHDLQWAGRGASTPSHTALVLWCFSRSSRIKKESAFRAARYLIEQFGKSSVEKNSQHSLPTWSDPSVVGTGHPGLLYLDYLSYPKTLPLMALALFKSRNSL